MAGDWEISKATGRCTATGREFAEGEVYFAALLETPEGFERRDCAADAWTGPPEGCFCYWRARVPVREKKPRTISIDSAMLTHLFLRLEDEESEMRQQFRFVLALLLMRKRLLKFEETVRDGEQEYWQLRLVTEQSVHRVLNPHLTDDQVDRLGAQLTALLSGEVHAIESLDHVGETAEEGEMEGRREGETERSGDRGIVGRRDG